MQFYLMKSIIWKIMTVDQHYLFTLQVYLFQWIYARRAGDIPIFLGFDNCNSDSTHIPLENVGIACALVLTVVGRGEGGVAYQSPGLYSLPLLQTLAISFQHCALGWHRTAVPKVENPPKNKFNQGDFTSFFSCKILHIHTTSVSGCLSFTFKICQTVVGTSMVHQFHNFFQISFSAGFCY
jgi:hypothetical protein